MKFYLSLAWIFKDCYSETNPGGIEPPSSGPKPEILSIKLWVHEDKTKFVLI